MLQMLGDGGEALSGITFSLQVQPCPLGFHGHVWGWMAETSRENIQSRGRLIEKALFFITST